MADMNFTGNYCVISAMIKNLTAPSAETNYFIFLSEATVKLANKIFFCEWKESFIGQLNCQGCLLVSIGEAKRGQSKQNFDSHQSVFVCVFVCGGGRWQGVFQLKQTVGIDQEVDALVLVDFWWKIKRGSAFLVNRNLPLSICLPGQTQQHCNFGHCFGPNSLLFLCVCLFFQCSHNVKKSFKQNLWDKIRVMRSIMDNSKNFTQYIF